MTSENKPFFINTDSAVKNLQPEEAIFIKDAQISINKNTGDTANVSGEGQNEFVLTPVRSTTLVPNFLLPTVGRNKNVGAFQCKQTNETYCLTYNSQGQHCIHVISGDDGSVRKVYQGQYLQFTDNQENFIQDNRCLLRVIKNADNEIIEKILLMTDYGSWQKWVNVISAIGSDGFNEVLYPYWEPKQPHFDRYELVEWPTRPPMFMPEFETLPNTLALKGVPNRIMDTAFEICYQFVNTDGRFTTVSPYSLPAITKSTDFLSNPDLIPKRYQFTFAAGSPLTERINVYVRQTTRMADSDLQRTFGDWYLYDTLYKFKQSKNNVVLGTAYWLRQNPWVDFNYDPDRNTIEYVFDNSKFGVPVSDTSIFRYQTDMPQISCALADAGDAVLLANNRHEYDNLSATITEKINVDVDYVQDDICNPPIREVKIYAGAFRERLNENDEEKGKQYGMWLPQVGYHVGEDEQERFGGILFETKTRVTVAPFLFIKSYQYEMTGEVKFDVDESKYFELDFADREGFVCYAKGTPYFAVGKWVVVDKNFNKTLVNGLLDSESSSDRDFYRNTIVNGGFFLMEFTFHIPAGRYDFALGRHNVASTEDYQGQSTYVMGIADSRKTSRTKATQLRQGVTFLYGAIAPGSDFEITTITPSAIIDSSKEIEIDCTNGNIDLWRTGKDMFYIFCPFGGSGRDSNPLREIAALQNPMNRWSFNEGYMYEARNSTQFPMERFQYESTFKEHYSSGVYTDKNGFWFTYQWGDNAKCNSADIRFYNSANCSTLDFTVSNNRNNIVGWKPGNIIYFADRNVGLQVGVANRVLLTGRITTTGGIPLTRIAITVKDGGTDFTNDNGEFFIYVHNGLFEKRVSSIFVNAGGNFSISMPQCGAIPLYTYDENNTLYYPSCRQTGTERVYGQQIVLSIEVQSGELKSLKSGGTYVIDVVLHDLAGRQTWAQRIGVPTVLSFPQRDPSNTYASVLTWLLSGPLLLNQSNATRDLKWLSFAVTKYVNYRKYLQWVGNGIEFLDQNGNVTTNPQTSDLVRIDIKSLLDTNIQNNLTLLASYQFIPNDRLRIFDNGDGLMFDTATYGDVIDVEILGNSYNQAAINANLLVPPVNTVLNPSQASSVTPDPTKIYVKYDSRFDKLKDKVGFWIELYTPELVRDVLNFGECEACFPIINGELQEYVSGGPNNPTYQPITNGTIRYWDTYQLKRSITGIGKYISHSFESPNITDTWGVNGISSGRSSAENPDAKQMFYVDDVFKSNAFVMGGTKNGLSTFIGSAPDKDNRKSYKRAAYGGIVAMRNEGSIVFILCERNWFVTDYNMIFVQSNSQGQLIQANLTDKLGEPHQKVGSYYGCAYKDVSTVIMEEGWIGWHDSKNSAYFISDWNVAKDITELREEGRLTGIASYYQAKSEAIENWNIGKSNKDKFDVVAGYDTYVNKLFITFRPRRDNSTNVLSFVNRKRDYGLLDQETFVFDTDFKRWVRFAGYTPEGYGSISGNIHSQDILSFVNGQPYYHNAATNSYLNFYGVYVRPVFTFAINKNNAIVKIAKGIKIDCNGVKMLADLIYTEAPNSFSYLPSNLIVDRDKIQYGGFLRDASSYPPIETELSYRNMLQDGKPITGTWAIIRIMPEVAAQGKYFELNVISIDTFESVSNKKPVDIQ